MEASRVVYLIFSGQLKAKESEIALINLSNNSFLSVSFRARGQAELCCKRVTTDKTFCVCHFFCYFRSHSLFVQLYLGTLW